VFTVTLRRYIDLDPNFFMVLTIIGIFIGGHYLKRKWKIETLDSVKLNVFVAFGTVFFGYMGLVFSLLSGVLALDHFQKLRKKV